MTAATLALFYQALLHDPNRVWDPAVLKDAKTNIRCTFSDNKPVDTQNTNPAVRSGALLDYQATYLSGDQLTRW